MPRDRIGHLWVLHAKSVPRNGLRERRDLERAADTRGSLFASGVIDLFQQEGGVGRMRPFFFHMRGATGLYQRLPPPVASGLFGSENGPVDETPSRRTEPRLWGI